MRRKNIIGQVCDTPKSYDNVMHVGLRKVTFKWQRGNKIGKDTKEHDTFAPVEIAAAILLQAGRMLRPFSHTCGRCGVPFTEGAGGFFPFVCKMCPESSLGRR